MRPRTTKEYRELSREFFATCTAGSIMFGMSRLVTPLSDVDKVPLLVATVEPMKPLITAAMADDKRLTLEVLVEHFASPEHYQAILKGGTMVGNEIPPHPKGLRPVLHTLLPLDEDGVYRNAGVEIEPRHQVEFGQAEGVGFWAAHLAGKVWIPRNESYRQKILAMQAESSAFVEALKVVAKHHPVVDYSHYPRLKSQTISARDESLKQCR